MRSLFWIFYWNIDSWHLENLLFVISLFNVYWNDHLISILHSITLINLHVLQYISIPGRKPTWSFFIYFLACSWILFKNILLRIFILNDLNLCSSHRLVSIFTAVSLSSLGNQGNTASRRLRQYCREPLRTLNLVIL